MFFYTFDVGVNYIIRREINLYNILSQSYSPSNKS